MDQAPSNTRYAERLQHLAESRHAIITEPLAALSRSSVASTNLSTDDRSAAIRLLQGQRNATSKKSKQSDFNYKEIHAGLRDVVNRQGEHRVAVALIQMLLSTGANVNVSREGMSLK
jgi:hypothetical protein